MVCVSVAQVHPPADGKAKAKRQQRRYDGYAPPPVTEDSFELGETAPGCD